MTTGLILLFSLLFTGATRLEGQTVTGRVTAESDGTALQAVSVTLLLASNDVVRRAITDEQGRYHLDASEAGDYRVVADHLGYRRLESPLARIGADQTVTIDFELPIDPIEVEGVEVEVQRREELRRRVMQYGVSVEWIGARFVPRSEIEKRETALNIGQVLQWQNLAGIKVLWSDSPIPSLCVRSVRAGSRCALTVLDGVVIDDEFAASVPPQSLEAVVVLRPMEATLSFGTDGGGGAVLLFTRAGLAGR